MFVLRLVMIVDGYMTLVGVIDADKVNRLVTTAPTCTPDTALLYQIKCVSTTPNLKD